MQINIKIHKKIQEDWTLNLDSKIALLIWENGCGKTSILESAFKTCLEDNQKLVIVFSSGLNESYSFILEEYKKKIKRLTYRGWSKQRLNGFFFNRHRASLLIFFAFWLVDGKVRSFLSKKYNITELWFNYSVCIDKSYIYRLSKWYWEEDGSLLTSQFHIWLDNLLTNSVISGDSTSAQVDYDFSSQKKFSELVLSSNCITSVFWSTSERFDFMKELLSFFGLLTHKNRFLDIEDTRIYLGSFWIQGLSDGEFQLLNIYALLDLFDSENTLFLFDEIDSHLHYENINIIWKEFWEMKGRLITTTHIADSIMMNEFEDIKLVENGLIDGEKKANAVINRLGNLCDVDIYAKKYASKIQYLALVEDETDWIIFTELVKIKLGDQAYNKLKKIQYVKCSSGYDTHNQQFADSKKKRIEKLNIVAWSNSSIQSIFCICDRDNLPLSSIGTNMKVTGENVSISHGKVFVLSRKRKQIENYLLSYSMLNNQWLLDQINAKIAPIHQLVQNNACDNEWVQNVEIKDDIKVLYSDSDWVDCEKLKQVLLDIPDSEISSDIECMYQFIQSKITN